jgi:hypothetical protein
MSTVQRLELKGVLVRLPDEEGVLFDGAKVMALARTWTPGRTYERDPEKHGRSTKLVDRQRGEIEARIMELLEQRKSLVQIVIELRVDAQTVRAVQREWKTSFEHDERERAKRESEAKETVAARQHAREKAQEDWRDHKLKLAKIEADARAAEARAAEARARERSPLRSA